MTSSGSPCGRSTGTPLTAAWIWPLWSAVWAVALLLSPALHLGGTPHPWPVGAGLLVILGCFCRAVADPVLAPRQEGPLPRVLLGVQTVMTGALATFAWDQWTLVVLLLAIAVGAVIRAAWAPAAVLVLAVLAAGVVRAHGAPWNDAIWSTGLTVLLAGMLTFAFARLSITIRQLHAAREELTRAAVSQERLRFARDLHDLLGHSLSVIVVKAEATRRIAPRDAEAAAAHAADIEAIGRKALDEVRAAVRGYRDAGLREELVGARTTLDAAGVAVALPDEPLPSDPEHDALLGWVVREGTTNVLRHAHARHCRITLAREGEVVRLEIQDDGPGDTGRGGVGAATPPGSGLAGLRERLAVVGGELRTSSSTHGFLLTALLPASATSRMGPGGGRAERDPHADAGTRHTPTHPADRSDR